LLGRIRDDELRAEIVAMLTEPPLLVGDETV
jgi:hypothetical protein